MGKNKHAEPGTEAKILAAARELFAQRGYAGTRMQEIADYAGINKGLLHYYFKTKETLFKAVFKESFQEFSQKLNEIFASSRPLLEKLDAVVDEYMYILLANPNLPGFIVSELHTNTEAFVEEIMSLSSRPDPSKLMMQLHLEAQAGRIRLVDPFQTMLHLFSMCVFPFIARPMIQGMVHLDNQTYMELMRHRKAAIKDFLRHALLPEDQTSSL